MTELVVELDVESLGRLGVVEQRESFASLLDNLRNRGEFGVCLRDRTLDSILG
jgi:hypothetical protein